MSDEPAGRSRAADPRPARPPSLAGAPVGTSPRRGSRPPCNRRSPILLLVTGTTASKDRTLIGNGIADEEDARRLALVWSRAVRYEVTSVRFMRSRAAICSFRGGTEIPVPPAEQQPHPQDWDAAMVAMADNASALQAFAETCSVLSEAQACSLGEHLQALEDACRAVRSAQARAYRDALTAAGLAAQPPPESDAQNEDLEASA